MPSHILYFLFFFGTPLFILLPAVGDLSSSGHAEDIHFLWRLSSFGRVGVYGTVDIELEPKVTSARRVLFASHQAAKLPTFSCWRLSPEGRASLVLGPPLAGFCCFIQS